MENLRHSVEELVGNTPLMVLERYSASHQHSAVVMGKMEYLNPAGSAKDRPALYMIQDAEARGVLKAGGIIIEPTSGNTGIGLASIAAARGYRVILTMPDTMSVERRTMLSAYGAELVLTAGELGMHGASDRAVQLAAELPNSFIPSQFTNPTNVQAHYETTGPEIWRDADGKVDVLIAGVGTGGTLCGTARYLREKNPELHIIAIEPATSALLSGRSAGAHKIQGIGANFIPENVDTALFDEIMPITNEEAYHAGRHFARTEGILLGISSGAALAACDKIASQEIYKGKRIVVILPDSGDRYLSSGMFG